MDASVLKQYVAEARKAGFPDDAIKKKLQAADVAEDKIAAAFDAQINGPVSSAVPMPSGDSPIAQSTTQTPTTAPALSPQNTKPDTESQAPQHKKNVVTPVLLAVLVVIVGLVAGYFGMQWAYPAYTALRDNDPAPTVVQNFPDDTQLEERSEQDEETETTSEPTTNADTELILAVEDELLMVFETLDNSDQVVAVRDTSKPEEDATVLYRESVGNAAVHGGVFVGGVPVLLVTEANDNRIATVLYAFEDGEANLVYESENGPHNDPLLAKLSDTMVQITYRDTNTGDVHTKSVSIN